MAELYARIRESETARWWAFVALLAVPVLMAMVA